MIKLAFFDTKPYDEQTFSKLLGNDVEIVFYEAKLGEQTVGLAKGFDAVVVFVNDVLNSAVINKLYEFGIKLIVLRCAGYDNVDVKACYGKIHIERVPGYSPEAVAEHAAALLLSGVRHINRAYNRTRDFNFSLNGLLGKNLNGKTVGIFGLGKIGASFAKICNGFGMKIIAVDKRKSIDEGSVEYVDKTELLKRADVISLHCPLTEENKHLLGKNEFAIMKDGAVVINTSRGALIDTTALIAALKAKKLSGCMLDVYEEETDLFFEDRSGHILNDDNLAILLSMPNVIITSHQGFFTEEAVTAIAEITLDNVRKYFNENQTQNELCYHCGRVDDCKKMRSERCF